MFHLATRPMFRMTVALASMLGPTAFAFDPSPVGGDLIDKSKLASVTPVFAVFAEADIRDLLPPDGELIAFGTRGKDYTLRGHK